MNDDRAYACASPGTDYFVIGIDTESFRIIDDNGEPILYPKPLFDVLDARLPAGLAFREYSDDQYFIDPVCVGPGFYEDYFFCDGNVGGQIVAQKALRSFLQQAAADADPIDRAIIERDFARLSPIGCCAGNIPPHIHK